MRIILLGAPGCGKGTQSQLLRRRYDVPQVSTGDMLRTGIANGSALGEKARSFVNAGALVPDDVIVELVKERLEAEDASKGFILDGFPRSIPQAEGLGRILQARSLELDRVVKIDVNKKTLLDRMTSRRVCPGCGAVYNLDKNPPQQEGICDKCATRLVQRGDDAEETVRKRLNVYESSTAPLIDYYDGRGLLSIVNGEGTIDAVTERIVAALESSRAGR